MIEPTRPSDLTIEVLTKTRVRVKLLRVRCGVRYWEDATVNGKADEDGSLIPFRRGEEWCPLIDLAEGRIIDWPQGVTADIHYKVCDDGVYELLDKDGHVMAKRDGYVIKMMRPGEAGDDYVIMSVGADGVIANWRVDLSDFEKDSERP